ncbi:MAG: capsule assembly Wzi family protein [Bacteroidota bacterium]
MKLPVRFILLIMTVTLFCSSAYPQAENVPTVNPVYVFLKRMEVKGIIERYRDAILPLSRRQVAEYLVAVKAKEDLLTQVERDQLSDYSLEFQYDITHSTEGFYNFLDFGEPDVGSMANQLFMSERQKFLYAYTDSNATLFVDGLATIDARRSTGDALHGQNAEFIQLGGRMRGTVYNKVGYYIQGTNAAFWGSRAVLLRDNILSQAYTLVHDAEVQNFDFSEGYVRYDGNILSAEIGQERMLWGTGYGNKLILSDNPRVFPFIRLDAEYKSLKYTFLHAWLLGTRSNLVFSLPSDTSAKFVEPLDADKYLAAHRLELSFPSLFDIGFQEMIIYSNRSIDGAYLNPLILLESAQRSRDERDNNFWAFDIKTHFLKNVQLQASIDFDDIFLKEWFKNNWDNKDAFQVGMMFTDPLGVSNATFAVEYSHIEPFTFSHGRSRDDNYGSDGRILGDSIGPNAESWFFRLDDMLTHKLSASLRFQIQRHGRNVYDAQGRLIQNVGGDYLQPHRDTDPEQKDWLGGDLVRTYIGQVYVTYQIVHQIFLDVHYQYTHEINVGLSTENVNQDFGGDIRFDF